MANIASLDIASNASAGSREAAIDSARRGEADVEGKATSLIEITVTAADRLFHELDPSPLAGRNLDQQVESYILACARELPAKSYALRIHVPRSRMPNAQHVEALALAIRAHFAERADEQDRRLRALMREGRQALAVGIAFLFLCGALGLLALRALPAPFGSFLEEGLLIIGWVANWRPLEILLYDWRPVRREHRMLGSLSRMTVDFRSANFQLAPGTGNAIKP
jgi:hypothetical protein